MPKHTINPRRSAKILMRSHQGSDMLAYVAGIGWSWEVDSSGLYCTPDEYKIVRDQLNHAGQNALIGNRWKTCIA